MIPSPLETNLVALYNRDKVVFYAFLHSAALSRCSEKYQEFGYIWDGLSYLREAATDTPEGGEHVASEPVLAARVLRGFRKSRARDFLVAALLFRYDTKRLVDLLTPEERQLVTLA